MIILKLFSIPRVWIKRGERSRDHRWLRPFIASPLCDIGFKGTVLSERHRLEHEDPCPNYVVCVYKCVCVCVTVCVCVCVSWQTQMAGGQGGRWAKRTGSSKGEFWLRGSDGGTDSAQSCRRYRTQGVGYTPGHKGHTHTHTHTHTHILVYLLPKGHWAAGVRVHVRPLASQLTCKGEHAHTRVCIRSHTGSHRPRPSHPLLNQADPLKRARINCQRPCLVV